MAVAPARTRIGVKPGSTTAGCSVMVVLPVLVLFALLVADKAMVGKARAVKIVQTFEGIIDPAAYPGRPAYGKLPVLLESLRR